jgi:hypothetical protein
MRQGQRFRVLGATMVLDQEGYRFRSHPSYLYIAFAGSDSSKLHSTPGGRRSSPSHALAGVSQHD